MSIFLHTLYASSCVFTVTPHGKYCSTRKLKEVNELLECFILEMMQVEVR